MPIDQAIKDIEIWADSGDRTSPEDAGVTTDAGWPLAAEQVGGMSVSRGLMNELFYRITSWAVEVRDAGLPMEWDAEINYIHDSTGIAFVKGSDGLIYRSVQASGPAGGNATDPVTDSMRTYWRLY